MSANRCAHCTAPRGLRLVGGTIACSDFCARQLRRVGAPAVLIGDELEDDLAAANAALAALEQLTEYQRDNIGEIDALAIDLVDETLSREYTAGAIANADAALGVYSSGVDAAKAAWAPLAAKYPTGSGKTVRFMR
jgi:hypothetical protein